MTEIRIGDVPCGGGNPLLLIAGPCQIEGLDHALMCASRLAEIAAQTGMGFVYKSSFDKANRTSGKARRGVGFDAGLEVMARVKQEIGCPVLSDVHLPGNALARLRCLMFCRSLHFYAARQIFCWQPPKLVLW